MASRTRSPGPQDQHAFLADVPGDGLQDGMVADLARDRKCLEFATFTRGNEPRRRFAKLFG